MDPPSREGIDIGICVCGIAGYGLYKDYDAHAHIAQEICIELRPEAPSSAMVVPQASWHEIGLITKLVA